MGCCVSSLNDRKSTSHHTQDHHCSTPQNPYPSSYSPNDVVRSKSPPLTEEETVKEVLSETPKPGPKVEVEDKEEESKKKIQIPKPLFPKREELVFQDKKFEKSDLISNLEDEVSEVTVSEICSLSESIGERREEEEEREVKQRIERSPAQLRNSRNYPSPVRRSEPSPGRREIPSRRTPATAERRSRSPANRSSAGTAAIGRSPSGRRTAMAQSPQRRISGPESGRKAEERDREGKWGPGTMNNNNNESLENPLVSLECFIFL